ncbi:MAG: four helix bundle protein [Desulfobacteraceae bacterium]|nr:four helix bundle protein [Desulfobacteraceae bacterium]
MAYSSFEDLEVWKRAKKLAVELFLSLKDCKAYGLKDQMTRSAVSVASNIAEGAERGTSPEFIRFLRIAKGSAAELRTQLSIASEAGLIHDVDRHRKWIVELKEISSILQGLIHSLHKNIAGTP